MARKRVLTSTAKTGSEIKRPEVAPEGIQAVTPEEFLSRVMNDGSKKDETRIRAAVALAGILKGRAPAAKGKKEQRNEAASEASTGLFAPRSPPGTKRVQ